MSVAHENGFALDTVHFLNKKTTDSDPFGDRDQVASRSVLKKKQTQQAIATQSLQNELLRDEVQRILAVGEDVEATQTLPTTFSDAQLLINVKKWMLENDPANLVNVLLFWINFQVSHGMPNHNQCVLNMLQDMKNLFVAQNAPPTSVLTQMNQVLCNLVQNLTNEDYDSTESIVDFIQLVGVYFMRAYLLERQVINNDPESFDLLTTWICFTFIMTRQLPTGLKPIKTPPTSAAEKSKELLQCMQAFENIKVPSL